MAEFFNYNMGTGGGYGIDPPDYLHLPPQEQLRRSERFGREKYKLPGFGYGVDGVHIVFEENPRRIPRNRIAQQFFNRKMKYSINAQCIGGTDGLIYDGTERHKSPR